MGGDNQNRITAGRTAIREERFAAAEQLARDALEIDPHEIDALEILFLCQQRFGDGAGAERTLRRVIALAPHKQWPRGDLARLLIGMGRAAEAEQVLTEAVAADPRHADAHAMLGSLLSEREALVPGTRHLERAIALAGRHPQLLANLGRNLMRQGRLDEAEPLLQSAMAAAPDQLNPIIHLAELAEQRDQFDRAAALLDRAEPIAARQGLDVHAQRAHLLSRTSRWREALALLDEVTQLSGTPRLLRSRLRDRAGRYEEAWEDAVAAKAALARVRRHFYDAEAVGCQFSALRHFAEKSARLAGAAKREGVPQPLFILGFPRSGTTLTEQVLASHSQIRPGGELPFAGHPTLGSCHAWLEAGGRPKTPGRIVQQCATGLVPIRIDGERLAFAAPPSRRSAPSPSLLAKVAAALGLKAQQIVAAQLLDNGPVWLGLLLSDADTVLALKPDHRVLKELGQKVGVAGVPVRDEEPAPALIARSNREARAFARSEAEDIALEVRAFAAPIGVEEDPVTGSLNASVAQWLYSSGRVEGPYVAAQGTKLGRRGRVHLSRDREGRVWVGGTSVSLFRGSAAF